MIVQEQQQQQHQVELQQNHDQIEVTTAVGVTESKTETNCVFRMVRVFVVIVNLILFSKMAQIWHHFPLAFVLFD